MDNLKGINDTLGHAFGDTALITLAHKVRKLVRAEDIVARTGEDEFTIIWISENESGFMKIAETLESQLADLTCLTTDPNHYELNISCSVGFTAVSAFQSGFLDDILKTADNQMYLKKATRKALGKNPRT
jgi:diguanylate cyclase (GGDEF)-like protein